MALVKDMDVFLGILFQPAYFRCVQRYNECLFLAQNSQALKALTDLDSSLKIWAETFKTYIKSSELADENSQFDEELCNLVVQLLDGIESLILRVSILLRAAPRYPHIDVNPSDIELSSFESDIGNESSSIVISELQQLQYIMNQLISLTHLVRQPKLTSVNTGVLSSKAQYAEGYEELHESIRLLVVAHLWRKCQPVDARIDATVNNLEEGCNLTSRLFNRLISTAKLRRRALMLKSEQIEVSKSDFPAYMLGHPKQTQYRQKENPQHATGSTHWMSSSIAVDTIDLVRETLPSTAKQFSTSSSLTASAQEVPEYSSIELAQISRLDIPDPSLTSTHAQKFECFICGQILDRETTYGFAWRIHVLRDINPFVCLFEECSIPFVLYKTVEAWLNHMQEHFMVWSCMVNGHQGLQFASQEDLRDHLVRIHSRSFSTVHMDLLLRRGMRPLPINFDKCPLCQKSVIEIVRLERKEIPSLNWSFYMKDKTNIMLRHVENHMHEIALLSLLPYFDQDVRTESVHVSEGSKIDYRSFLEHKFEEADLFLIPEAEDRPGEPQLLSQDDRLDLETAQTPQTPGLEDRDLKLLADLSLDHQQWTSDNIWTFKATKGEVLTDALLYQVSSTLAEREECPESCVLKYDVADVAVSNLRIHRDVQRLIQPVDLTIYPAANGAQKRTVLIYLSNEEQFTEAKLRLKGLSKFLIDKDKA